MCLFSFVGASMLPSLWVLMPAQRTLAIDKRIKEIACAVVSGAVEVEAVSPRDHPLSTSATGAR